MLPSDEPSSASNARWPVLLGTVGLFAALDAVVPYGVLGTIVFAATVASLRVPLARRVEARGLPRWWAAAVTSVVASLAEAVPLLADAENGID